MTEMLIWRSLRPAPEPVGSAAGRYDPPDALWARTYPASLRSNRLSRWLTVGSVDESGTPASEASELPT